MDEKQSGLGGVVVNRSMSLDGFIAAVDDAMDRVIEFMKLDPFPEIEAATGAVLVGWRTLEVAERISHEKCDYDGGPGVRPDPPTPNHPCPGVTFLTGDLEKTSGTVRAAAGGKKPGEPRS